MKNFILIIANVLLVICEWFNMIISILALALAAAFIAYSFYDFGECVLSGTEEVCLGKE